MCMISQALLLRNDLNCPHTKYVKTPYIGSNNSVPNTVYNGTILSNTNSTTGCLEIINF